MIGRIDGEISSARIPTANDLTSKLANLEDFYATLISFLEEECEQNLPLPGGAPDLEKIARLGALPEVNKLLKLVFVAAVKCSDPNPLLMEIRNLPAETGTILMSIAQQAGPIPVRDGGMRPDSDSEDFEVEGDAPDRTVEPVLHVDSDLASEERLGIVIAEKEKALQVGQELQDRLQVAEARCVELQQKDHALQSELEASKDRLAAALAGRSTAGSSKIDGGTHEADITTLEGKLARLEEDALALQKENEVLKVKAKKTQKLQDELDEAKVERSNLVRKANTVDKYKLKLEAHQELECENQDLKSKILVLQQELKSSDSNQFSSSDLRREITEYRRVLPGIEQERHELNEMKKRLEVDYHALEARWQDTTEQSARQEATIEELRSRLQDYEDGQTPTSPLTSKINSIALPAFDIEFDENETRRSEQLLNIDADGQNAISEGELFSIMSAMKAQAQDAALTERVMSEEEAKRLALKIETNRQVTKQLIEHTRKQSALISILRSKSTSTPTFDSNMAPLPPPPPAEAHGYHVPDPEGQTEALEDAKRLIQNLQRELRLMASAWYDQNIRLANSSMSATRTRAKPEPVSFLGRHRRVVDDLLTGRLNS